MKHWLATFALFLATALASPTLAAPSPPFKATLRFPTESRRQSDADTFDAVRADGHAAKVRPHIFDAPEISHSRNEIDQPGGREALAYARKHWEGREAILSSVSRSYDRDVVRIPGYALDLISHGHGWVDPRFKPGRRAPAQEHADYKALVDAQAKAKADKLGLWNQPAIPPWQWRANQRIQQQKPRNALLRRR